MMRDEDSSLTEQNTIVSFKKIPVLLSLAENQHVFIQFKWDVRKKDVKVLKFV